jgi:hypothetical protein
MLQLIRLPGPFLGVGHGILHLGDAGPDFGELRVQLQEDLLVFRQFVLGEDSVNRALRLTQSAVDTFVRVNHQEIGALVKTVHRAYFHAVRVFTVDAIFAYNKCHS